MEITTPLGIMTVNQPNRKRDLESEIVSAIDDVFESLTFDDGHIDDDALLDPMEERLLESIFGK